MQITRRAALRGTAGIHDPVLAARNEHERAHRAFNALPDTPAGEDAKNALTAVICQAEIAIMQAEPATLSGALAQVETLCHWWGDDGLPQGAEAVIKRLADTLSERIEGLKKEANTSTKDALCAWCGKHRESLVKVSDNINDLHRGARALVEIALTDGIDTTDTFRFIGEQMLEIAERADDAFDAMSLWHPSGGVSP